MSRNHAFIVSFAAIFAAAPLNAADNTGEARLREALKNVTLQLRAAEGERDNLQGVQAASAQEKKTLAGQIEALNKQVASDKELKETTDKAIVELNAKLTEQTAAAARLQESLDKWKAAQKQAADLATAKEAQRAKLAGDVIVLERHIADQQVKNVALSKLANEILTRYEKFGLGDAIGAREPFIGITRVKLENLVQDYQDKVLAQKIKP